MDSNQILAIANASASKAVVISVDADRIAASVIPGQLGDHDPIPDEAIVQVPIDETYSARVGSSWKNREDGFDLDPKLLQARIMSDTATSDFAFSSNNSNLTDTVMDRFEMSVERRVQELVTAEALGMKVKRSFDPDRVKELCGHLCAEPVSKSEASDKSDNMNDDSFVELIRNLTTEDLKAMVIKQNEEINLLESLLDAERKLAKLRK